jgi:LacI family transcriptional regulator
MTSIKDVAKLANVSTATVSHVINGTRFVSEETKRRVYAAMDELSYRPNSIARSLRSKKTNIVGLLVPILPEDTSNFFFMSVAQGIQSVLMENGYHLILGNSKEDLQTEIEQIKVFDSEQIDGLIMAPTFEDHSYLHECLTGNYPVVFIDRKPKDYVGDCILADGAKGTDEAVSLLIEKGHRQIGFITGSLGITSTDSRLEGYRNALTRHGLEIDESLIKIAESSYSSFDTGYHLARELIEQGRITAMFVANNVMTMGALHYLQEHQIRIPEDIALIGFDDYEWARITRPALTMVKQPSYELGEEAAKQLLKRIREPEGEPVEIYLPTSLTIRASC